MTRNIQRSLFAVLAATTFAAGSAIAARDPGTQSPTSPSNSTIQQSNPAATSSNGSASNATSTSNYQTASAAAGSNPSMTAQDKFSQLDVNTDGMIDKQEASASSALKAEFSRLDTNKDGKLSLDEFSAAKNLASTKVDKTTSGNKKGY